MFRRALHACVSSLLAALLAVCADPGASTGAEPTPIELSERVDAGGAALYVETRGADRDDALVLWLHGGPGGAERPLFRLFNGDLEQDFVVAYLDQRGAGRSFDPDADPRQLTVARHLADLDVVVDHLRRSVGRERIALIGHSWGGALALLYAQRHPEKVLALIAVSPLISTAAAKQAEYDFVLAEANRRSDEEALARLREIGPPPYPSVDDLLALERLAGDYGAVFHQPPSSAWTVLRGIFAGVVTPWEIPRLIRGNRVTLDAMNGELLELDLSRSVPAVDVPVIFVLGRYDQHVSAEVAAAYFEALQAPAKQIVWFEASAHNSPFEEPARFNEVVARELQRTLASGADAGR